jgi:hypothetical protein
MDVLCDQHSNWSSSTEAKAAWLTPPTIKACEAPFTNSYIAIAMKHCSCRPEKSLIDRHGKAPSRSADKIVAARLKMVPAVPVNRSFETLEQWRSRVPAKILRGRFYIRHSVMTAIRFDAKQDPPVPGDQRRDQVGHRGDRDQLG